MILVWFWLTLLLSLLRLGFSRFSLWNLVVWMVRGLVA